MTTTTIQLDTSTRQALTALKSSPRETYDELIRKLVSLIPTGDDEGEYTDSFRAGLLQARLDVMAGRTISHEDLKKRLGLE